MTTIVVVRKGNQVAIAGDSQSTFGDTRLSARFDAGARRHHDDLCGLAGGFL